MVDFPASHVSFRGVRINNMYRSNPLGFGPGPAEDTGFSVSHEGYNLGVAPKPVTVTTRIITCLVV